MATLTYNGESFTVDHAVKGADYINGYDANGILVVSFDGVADFSCFSYDGSYMSPSDCLAEPCNEMVYCGGKAKTRGGADVPASAFGAAAANHGNHVPTTEKASNNRFLRNDNTWQTVTPAGIGARPDTWLPSLSDIGAAAANHGNHLYFQDNVFTTNTNVQTTINAPGTIVAVFINFRGNNSWTNELMFVPAVKDNCAFACYGNVNGSLEDWPMQVWYNSETSIGIGKYTANSTAVTCYCRTLYVQN